MSDIEFLKRSLCRQRIWLCLVTAALATSWLAGFRSLEGETVRAHRFELLDEQDRVRGILHVNEAGPRLTLLDDAGRKRVILGIQATAPGLELLTERGRHAVQVRHLNGEPIVSLHDDEGFEKLVLEVESGKAEISVRQPGGEVDSRWPVPDSSRR
ncbi:MAG: hypothetical protein RL885_28385 [Planctomycetota bacterium]